MPALSGAIVVLPSEGTYEDSVRQGVYSVRHTRPPYTLAVVLVVPCYRWGDWLRGHRPRSHSTEGPPDLLTLPGKESGQKEVPVEEGLAFIRGVPGSAAYSLELQVKSYLLPGASVFLCMKWADPFLQLMLGAL